jgi:hypothetical protein
MANQRGAHQTLTLESVLKSCYRQATSITKVCFFSLLDIALISAGTAAIYMSLSRAQNTALVTRLVKHTLWLTTIMDMTLQVLGPKSPIKTRFLCDSGTQHCRTFARTPRYLFLREILCDQRSMIRYHMIIIMLLYNM